MSNSHYFLKHTLVSILVLVALNSKGQIGWLLSEESEIAKEINLLLISSKKQRRIDQDKCIEFLLEAELIAIKKANSDIQFHVFNILSNAYLQFKEDTIRSFYYVEKMDKMLQSGKIKNHLNKAKIDLADHYLKHEKTKNALSILKNLPNSTLDPLARANKERIIISIRLKQGDRRPFKKMVEEYDFKGMVLYQNRVKNNLISNLVVGCLKFNLDTSLVRLFHNYVQNNVKVDRMGHRLIEQNFFRFLEIEPTEKSIDEMKKYLSIQKHFNYSLSSSIAEIKIGEWEEELKNNKTAENYYRAAANANHNDLYFKMKANERLYQLLVKIGDKGEAVSIGNTLLSQKDESMKELQLKIRDELSAQFAAEDQERKINMLNIENDLATLKLQNEAKTRLLLTLAIAALGIISILLFILLRDKKKNHDILSEKNQVIQKALDEKELLLKEIHHRVKNNLQVISSLLHMQSEFITDELAQNAIQEGRDRVRSMALIHKNLYQGDNLKGIEVSKYFEKLIQNLFDSYKVSRNDINLIMDIDSIELDVDTLIPLGLISNELISNALKHAFKEGENSELHVVLKEIDNQLVLKVRDNGIGIEKAKTTSNVESFGYQMIHTFLEKMNGKIDIENDEGTSISISFSEYNKLN